MLIRQNDVVPDLAVELDQVTQTVLAAICNIIILNEPMSKHVRVYTDGGSRGNPGPSASGAVIKSLDAGKEGEVLDTVSRYLGETTNNQAEYMAIVIGLERALHIGATHVEVYMDSELATKQLNGEYKVKDQDLATLFLKVWNLKNQFKSCSFTHVRREKNKEADALVNKSLDEHLK